MTNLVTSSILANVVDTTYPALSAVDTPMLSEYMDKNQGYLLWRQKLDVLCTGKQYLTITCNSLDTGKQKSAIDYLN